MKTRRVLLAVAAILFSALTLTAGAEKKLS